MKFIKNLILLIVFCCLIASFFITKENNIKKNELKDKSDTLENVKSINNTIKEKLSINKEVVEDNEELIEDKNQNKEQINIELEQREIDKRKILSKVLYDSGKTAFSKTIIGFPSAYKPTEEFINIVNSYQGEFVPLDTLPETSNLCFDSNYQQYSFGIITIVNNNGIKEVYECVYTAENSGKWIYRGLANNQN